jgi:hypoxanthine phosphoribosyltransferase
MSTITVNGKTFQTSIPEAEIKQRVKELALQISKDFEGKTPLLLGVLNGAFIFAADLVRELTIPFEISFVKLASYQGTISSGKVKEIIGISENLQGRHVIIVEDIVDTGRTMHQMVESLGTRNPASVSVCSLFVKPDNMEEHVDVKYAAFTIPNKFILGYGLDFDQQARGLKDIYTLAENE